MKEKGRDIFYPIINAVIIAGVIIWFIGLYYLMIKAGIPYQAVSYTHLTLPTKLEV